MLVVAVAFLYGHAAIADDVICLVPSPGQATLLMVDCDTITPTVLPSDGTGYATEGTPCSSSEWWCDCGVWNPSGNCARWTVSSSPSSPDESVGALPSGVFELYLWATCTSADYDDGFSAFRADVQVTNVKYHGFVPIGPVLNAGTDTSLELAIAECPTFPTLIGHFVLESEPSSVDTRTWGRLKSLYQ